MTEWRESRERPAGPQNASCGPMEAFRQEWVVTVRGFGHVKIDRARADSQEEAERIVLARCGVEVHSAPMGTGQ